MEEQAKIEDLRELFESGKNPLAYIPYADALRRANALTLAMEVCKSGLVQDSHSVSGRTLLARILYDMGRYENALEELGFVLQLAYDAFGANFLMANILSKKREFNDALEIIKRLKKMNPSDPELLELEEYVQSQFNAADTAGDFLRGEVGTSQKPESAKDRVNVLLEYLKTLPGLSYSFAFRPSQEERREEADPVRKFFFDLDGMSQGKGIGALKGIMIELGEGSILVYALEQAILTIMASSDVNMGKLRLQIEKIFRTEKTGERP